MQDKARQFTPLNDLRSMGIAERALSGLPSDESICWGEISDRLAPKTINAAARPYINSANKR